MNEYHEYITARNDRPSNRFIDPRHRIYAGDQVEIWSDPDTAGLYFIRNENDVWEMEREELVATFGDAIDDYDNNAEEYQ